MTTTLEKVAQCQEAAKNAIKATADINKKFRPKHDVFANFVMAAKSTEEVMLHAFTAHNTVSESICFRSICVRNVVHLQFANQVAKEIVNPLNAFQKARCCRFFCA